MILKECLSCWRQNSLVYTVITEPSQSFWIRFCSSASLLSWICWCISLKKRTYNLFMGWEKWDEQNVQQDIIKTNRKAFERKWAHPFLLQLIACFLCKLLVVSIPPVSLSVPLWSSSLPVGAVVGGMCIHAGLLLPWLLSGSAVVYGGLRVKTCFGAAVNLPFNQSQCNTSKRPRLLTKPTPHSHLVIKGRLD